MRISNVASVFPERYYPQAFLSEALKKIWHGKLGHPELLDRLHSRSGIDGRYLALRHPLGGSDQRTCGAVGGLTE